MKEKARKTSVFRISASVFFQLQVFVTYQSDSKYRR